MPTGGLMCPISTVIIVITASQTGSNPSPTSMGCRIGAASRIIDMMSIIKPIRI
ncbi:hypothetical protein ES703_64487 [subsurface metagenome]